MAGEPMTATSAVESGLIPVSELGPPPDTLNNGDRLTQKEFHALYERMPQDIHAELIGGIVYMASPLRARHASNHTVLTTLLVMYRRRTPGTQACDNATIVLSDRYEPQPDLLMRVREEYGGQSKIDADGYVEGPPELIVEIADSSRALDLSKKRKGYARHGVKEYLVLNVKDQRLHGFDLSAHRECQVGTDGVYRSFAFPGLWINLAATLTEDIDPILETLDAGLATPEHAAFVAKLAAAKNP